MDSPIEGAAVLRKAGKLWFLGGRKPGVNPSEGKWTLSKVVKDGYFCYLITKLQIFVISSKHCIF